MVMVELVYCKITGKQRAMPKIHHFIPLVPWSCKKIKGKQKVMNHERTKNDGPSTKFQKKEHIKLVLDMSNEGPMFKMLESMMSGGKNGDKGAFEALNKLLKSGIPGLEGLFGGGSGGDAVDGGANLGARFVKLSDEDKKKFLNAVTGAGGKINARAAAALIAAAASGGDPAIANKIIEKMMSGLGDDIDPAMMAAMMATTALVARGASNEEILEAMQRELANSGLSPEEILAKTMLLQKAMAGDNSPAFVNKTLRDALNAAQMSPEELSKALYVEKALAAAAGTNPEDFAKIMLIQSFLADKGVGPDLLLQALLDLIDDDEMSSIGDMALKALRIGNFSIDELQKMLATSKALHGGKIRGMKEIQRILNESDLSTPEGIANALRKAIKSGCIDKLAFAKAAILQKALIAAGASPALLAKAMKLQKELSESGMAVHDIAHAMSLAMSMATDVDGVKDLTPEAVQAKFEEQIRKGITMSQEDIQAILDLIDAFGKEDSSEFSPETIRLFKKAMKQRRGSVDNVAETLISSLSASGQSKESIAKAMVKALKATGASPQEIAKTMQQAMAKSGATAEEIARCMAQAMADSGASPEEIAETLKETFAKAMADDPANAAEIARSMAEALALSGASAEDIAATMQEALAASLSMDGGGITSPEDLLDIAETVARTMAEAGASPSEIAGAIKAAMKSAQDNPAMQEELAITMAKAMADSGASGDQIVKAMREALEASGASQGEMAQALLTAIAASGVPPNEIAKTMQAALEESGLSPEEIQERVISAMVEAGATPEEIAEVLVQQQLLEAIGKSAENMSKSLLKQLRSGELSPEEVQQILQSGGLDPTSAAKSILVQKALTRCGADFNDIARAVLLQKALVESGNSNSSIIEAINNVIAESGISMEQAAEQIVLALGLGELNVEDVKNAIGFERLIDSGGVSADGVKPESSKETVTESLKEMIERAKVKPEAMMKTAMLQKLMGSLDMEPEALAKLLQLQKTMYDAGASPQDIALIMQMAEKGGNAKVSQNLIDILKEGLKGADIDLISNLVDAVNGSSLSPELTGKIIQLQAAIESKISTPEKSASKIAELMKDENVDSLALVDNFKKVLKDNGISNDTLEKSVLLQKLFQSASISPKELSALLEIQNSLLKAGATPIQISKALESVVSGSGNTLSSVAKLMSASLDQKRIKGDDVTAAGSLYDAIGDALSATKSDGSKEILSEIKPGLSQEEVNNILKAVLENNSLSSEMVAKVSLFQKLMSASDCSPEELAKALRIQNALLKSGAPCDVISQTISDTLEPRNKSLVDRFKTMLGDIIEGKPFQLSSNDLEFIQKYQNGMKSNSQSAASMKEILDSALQASGLTKDDMAKALMVQKAFVVSGVTPEALAQAIQFEKALSASGATPEEIVSILSKVCDPKYSDEEIALLMSKALENRKVTKEEIENITNLQKSLRTGGLCNDPELQGLISSGQVDLEVLGKAVLMQKLLTSSGLTVEDLGKAAILQQALLDAGVPPEKVAECLQRTLVESGVSLEHLATLMEIELKSSSTLCPEDIRNILHFDKVLGGANAAKLISQKLNTNQLRLLEALGAGGEGLINAMKSALGDVLEPAALQAMEVSKAMAAAGASKEEIEEMMAVILNRGGTVSQEFLEAIKEVMESGGNPYETLEMLRATLEEEMNSTTNALRQTFMTKIPTQEDIDNTCNELAQKLAKGDSSKNDVKIALVDILEEALQDIMQYEADQNMVFNYLMVSGLAAATDMFEKNGTGMTGDQMQEMARKEMMSMLERLLIEADLPDEVAKLSAYGSNMDSIKELLKNLFTDPKTSSALLRQVAFLFDFDEVEHTTVIGLALQDIMKDAKHRLRPWELNRHRQVRGFKRAKIPRLAYSQVYCFYKVLPDHVDGPAIGMEYE